MITMLRTREKLAQMVKFPVLRLCPPPAHTPLSAGSCPRLVQFRLALSALPTFLFSSFKKGMETKLSLGPGKTEWIVLA